MAGRTRREVLAGAGLAAASTGCLGARLPGTRRRPDLTVFLGAYHWGFVLLDADGTEHDQIELDPGSLVRVVAFNTGATDAIARLPEAVRDALPGHESLEARNEDRVPAPPSGDMHEALEAANERYPDHSVAVMPAGVDHMRRPMDQGMMLHPVPLPAQAQRPTVAGLAANVAGTYTVSCLTYCGYGHAFMAVPRAFVVE